MVLYDDRDERPGTKFADAELMGIPIRLVLSQRTLDENNAEITYRQTGETTTVNLEEVATQIKDKIQL